MSANKLLNFDLDSLDENSEEFELDRKKFAEIIDEKKIEVSPKKTSKINKKALIGLVVVVLLGLVVSSGDTSNNSSSPSVNTLNLQSPTVENKYNTKVGDFMCTSADASTAATLEPFLGEKNYLELELSRLNTESDQLEAMKKQIDYSTVTNYSTQTEIDAYNSDVDAYNVKLRKYKTAASDFTFRRDVYNKKVDNYKAFLSSHCK